MCILASEIYYGHDAYNVLQGIQHAKPVVAEESLVIIVRYATIN